MRWDQGVLVGVMGLVAGVCVTSALVSPAPHQPVQQAAEPTLRLVGYECEGAGGPLYAAEEDHFPKCRAIEALDGPVKWTMVVERNGVWKELVYGLTLRECEGLAEQRAPMGDVAYCERA